MAKLTPNIKKAFALSSVVGALLMATNNNGSVKLIALKIQVDKAMRVFNFKSRKEYYVISDKIMQLWQEMAETHNNELTDQECEVFMELVLNLMPKNMMKEFLCVTFTTNEKVRDSKKSELLITVLELDEKLNEMFGTVKTANRDTLAEVMVKPLRTILIKKDRDVAKPERLKKIRNRARWAREKVKKEKV